VPRTMGNLRPAHSSSGPSGLKGKAFKLAHADLLRAQHFFQHLLPRPYRAIATAVEVESSGAKLRVSVTGEMGFGEQGQSAHAARRGELMPGNLSENVEVEILNDTCENCA